MIKAKPLALAQKLKNIVDICEAADAEIEAQKLIQKGALDAGKENDGIEPAVVRKILARRKRLSKDPAETQRLEDLMTDYQFMLGEGREDARPWTQADDEISRVMALTNTSKPPKIEAIKKALGCSQGKAHKLRSIVAVRLAKKSSSSSVENEHEHSDTPHDADGVVTETQDAALRTEIPSGIPQTSGVIPPVVKPAPESREGAGTHSDEAAATPSVGAEEITPKTKPASVLPSPSVWQGITSVREAHHAAIEAAREARRLEREQDRKRIASLAALTDADMPEQPPFLRRQTEGVGA